MSEENHYPKDPRSTVNRYKDRATYDYETVHSIVNSSEILHVSFNPSPTDPFPTVLPMIGAVGSFQFPNADHASQPLDLYLHGYVSSRIMRVASDEDGEGLPMCISVTKLDGIVLALTPNNHSCNYRSAVVHGYAHVVTSEAEKLYALELMTNNLIPNRWANTRIPPTKNEMTSTSVLRVRIVSASAKARQGGPGDDKKDLGDVGITNSVWAGVVPVISLLGVPEPGPNNKVEQVPVYISEWIEEENARRKEQALAAAMKV